MYKGEMFDGNWHQIGGDVSAAIFGATFARYEAREWPYDLNRNGEDMTAEVDITQITYLPGCSSDFANENDPYIVEHYSFDGRELQYRWDMLTDAVQSFGMSDPDFEWDPITLCLALFEYGLSDTAGYGSGRYNSFAEAMQEDCIPADALIDPRQYNYLAPESRASIAAHREDFEDRHGKKLVRSSDEGNEDTYARIYCDWADDPEPGTNNYPTMYAVLVVKYEPYRWVDTGKRVQEFRKLFTYPTLDEAIACVEEYVSVDDGWVVREDR
jgi:hypothetical protein